jgi:hypothetical protein
MDYIRSSTRRRLGKGKSVKGEADKMGRDEVNRRQMEQTKGAGRPIALASTRLLDACSTPWMWGLPCAKRATRRR